MGRRRPLLVGLAVYAVAGVLCAIAPNGVVLIVFRGVQGLGGAFGLVIGYVFVRDGYAGEAAARYFSSLLLVTGLAPILAPPAGIIVLLACDVALPESLPIQRRQTGGLQATGPVYAHLLGDRTFLGYALTNAFVFAAMFASISGSPFVLEAVQGLSPQQYSVVFAVNAFGLVAAAQASGRLVGHRRAAAVAQWVIGSTAGGVALLVAVSAGAGPWSAVSPPLWSVSSGWAARSPSPP